MLIRSRKIRLIPTSKQEELFKKSAGIARWAYNFYIAEKERVYREYKSGKSDKQFIRECEVRKQLTILKHTTHTWLKEVGSNVIKQAVKDADRNYERYFKGYIDFKPKFKSKHKSKLSFYVNYERLVKTVNGFKVKSSVRLKHVSHY